MYAIIQKASQKPIGFHIEKKVASKYKVEYELVNKNESLVIKKVKNSKCNSYELNELYLVRFGDGYVPQKYLDACDYDIGQDIYDLTYTHDMLQKLILSVSNDKKRKKLMNADKIVLEELNSVQNEVYNLNYLQEVEDNIERFKMRM